MENAAGSNSIRIDPNYRSKSRLNISSIFFELSLAWQITYLWSIAFINMFERRLSLTVAVYERRQSIICYFHRSNSRQRRVCPNQFHMIYSKLVRLNSTCKCSMGNHILSFSIHSVSLEWNIKLIINKSSVYLEDSADGSIEFRPSFQWYIIALIKIKRIQSPLFETKNRIR